MAQLLGRPDSGFARLPLHAREGPRFYRELTRGGEFKNVPVIVITGLQGGQYAINRAVGHLRKPVDVNKLVGLVRKSIGLAA